MNNKADLDNHANQLNPNNPEYYNSRGISEDYEFDDEGFATSIHRQSPTPYIRMTRKMHIISVDGDYYINQFPPVEGWFSRPFTIDYFKNIYPRTNEDLTGEFTKELQNIAWFGIYDHIIDSDAAELVCEFYAEWPWDKETLFHVEDEVNQLALKSEHLSQIRALEQNLLSKLRLQIDNQVYVNYPEVELLIKNLIKKIGNKTVANLDYQIMTSTFINLELSLQGLDFGGLSYRYHQIDLITTKLSSPLLVTRSKLAANAAKFYRNENEINSYICDIKKSFKLNR